MARQLAAHSICKFRGNNGSILITSDLRSTFTQSCLRKMAATICIVLLDTHLKEHPPELKEDCMCGPNQSSKFDILERWWSLSPSLSSSPCLCSSASHPERKALGNDHRICNQFVENMTCRDFNGYFGVFSAQESWDWWHCRPNGARKQKCFADASMKLAIC